MCACVEMRGGKDPMWGRPAVQVLVTLLDEPRLEGVLRQCRPLLASSQYTAKVSKCTPCLHLLDSSVGSRYSRSLGPFAISNIVSLKMSTLCCVSLCNGESVCSMILC